MPPDSPTPPPVQEIGYGFKHPETGVVYLPTPTLRWVRVFGARGGKVLEQLFLSVPDQQQAWMPVPTFDSIASGQVGA